ncbi:FadR family transcriptional regulator [Microbispora sp. RL4-1S]|uniref:FadR family transcriptional regulator n=1 Tax=Microbispora oryzae TaxID=2806554 RepID=A0A940WGQ7_9ACTN|nr:FCD domain-containing protein [Microbispora oryzae]MBP2702892.1 FadR family transcriptional regulator [Microbispora oryzae]
MSVDDRAPARQGGRPRAFEEVLARIEERIAADGLTVGDRLPGERQLAEQLNVGRSSVREALRVLETLGVVSSQAGRGPDAGAVLTSRPAGALAGLLRLHLGLATLSLREVVDLRLMVEQWSAEHAARSGEGLAEMAAALAGMDAATGPGEFVAHDVAFHLAIAAASGNRLIVAIMEAVRGAVHRYAVDAVARLGGTSGLQADHRRIHAAIGAGDAPGAAAAIAAHLARVYPPGDVPGE